MTGNKKYKFMAAVIGLFLVPYLLLSRHFVSSEGELQKKDALSNLELRTATGAGIISDVLNLNYSLTRIAGGGAASGAAAIKAVLAGRVRENPFIYSELALLGASGAELARFSADKSVKLRLDYAKSQAFSEARQSLSPAGAVEYGEYTPPALVLAEPLMKNGSVPVYYVAGRLSLAYVGEVVRLMGRNSYGNFGLMDIGGQVIADSMSMSIVKPGLKAPHEVLKLFSMAAGRDVPSFASEVYFQGRVLLVSVSNVAGSKWWIYEIMDSRDLPVRNASTWTRRVVLSGILLIVIFGAVTYRLAIHWLRDDEDEQIDSGRQEPE